MPKNQPIKPTSNIITVYLVFIILIGLAIVLYYLGFAPSFGLAPKPEPQPQVQQQIVPTSPELEPEITETSLPSKVKHDVPFTAQAPFADWEDPRQQDGCEEASILMAMQWVKDQSLSKQEALDQILAMSKFEEKNYGFYRDSSTADTARLLSDYFDHEGEVVYDININDIKTELAAGNLVVVLVNGQILDNPNFSGDGPERHAIVVTGYNDRKQEFITNDPGTRRGEDFTYSYKNLSNSLQDYPSGYKVPITNPRTAMLVIKPQSQQNLTSQSMELTSSAFAHNDPIPSQYTCDGANTNPQLKISDVPAEAISLALIVDDPDAPNGDWVHWLVWDINPDTTEITADSTPVGSLQGTTDFGTTEYGGPCPPSGTHHYQFKLYALDKGLDLSQGATKAELAAAMTDHILEQTTLIGTYSKQ